jgi:hypothetical protein
MQFLPITIGSPDTIFWEDVMTNVEFRFPQPASRAEAVLQGFDLQFEESDCELDLIKVNLDTHFGANDRSGTVTVSFSLSDDSSGGIFLASNLIHAKIDFLVIGT